MEFLACLFLTVQPLWDKEANQREIEGRALKQKN